MSRKSLFRCQFPFDVEANVLAAGESVASGEVGSLQVLSELMSRPLVHLGPHFEWSREPSLNESLCRLVALIVKQINA